MGKLARSKPCKVFHADGGFKVVYLLSRDQAERLVDRGALHCEYNKITGRQIGYRLEGGARDKVDAELRSVTVAALMDERQMETHAFFGSQFSDRAIERAEYAVPEESKTARVEAKVRVFAVIGSVRGDILRVWPK